LGARVDGQFFYIRCANLKEEMSVAPNAASEPTRILVFLNRVPYPLNDGGAIGAFNFVKGYAEASCKMTMLAMNTAKHWVEVHTAHEVFDKYGKLELASIDNNIHPIDAFFNLFSSRSYIIQRFISEKVQNKLKEVLSQNTFDIVHIDGLPPAAYIDIIRAHSKAKISMRAHNVEHVIWERIVKEETKPLKKWYLSLQFKRLKKFEKEAYDKCDLIMAISMEDEKIIKASSKTKTIVVPAGMDIDETLPANDNMNPDLFFIGSFDWMPNLQGMEWFFKNVWEEVNKIFPALRFVIAGKKMPESITALQSDSVIIAGEVPDAKQFILEHGIMIVPLVSGSGIRIKIVEAMALGKTVIATTIAAEGLGLSDGENILIANNADEFVKQIGKCLTDPEFAKQVGRNAHRFALDNFQNKRIFEKLTAYYRQLA
jgi:glycosyltransferase involved in cell wall biosynthesis